MVKAFIAILLLAGVGVGVYFLSTSAKDMPDTESGSDKSAKGIEKGEPVVTPPAMPPRETAIGPSLPKDMQIEAPPVVMRHFDTPTITPAPVPVASDKSLLIGYIKPR
jgi:hypothetical protein